MPEDHMVIREQQTGRPCPYVLIEPENMGATDVVACLLSVDTHHLAPLLAEALMDKQELDAGERVALLSRISRAVNSPGAVAALHPPPTPHENKGR